MPILGLMESRWKLGIVVVLICLLLLEVIQHFFGYTLATVWGPLIVFTLACAAYVLLAILLWRKSRILSSIALILPIIPMLPFILHPIQSVVVAGMVVTNLVTDPVRQERISPTLSFRVFRYPGIWETAKPTYTYEVYGNPTELPFVWKQLKTDSDPCGQGMDADALTIVPGITEYAFTVSCESRHRFDSSEGPVP